MATADHSYLQVMGEAVMSIATDAVFVIDATTRRLVMANRAFTRAFGYQADAVPGLSLYDLVAADRDSVDRSLAQLAAAGEIRVDVRAYRARDGSIVEMESRAGVTEVAGKTLYCVVSRDLTEIRRAEKSLRESEERGRTFVEVAFEGIVISEEGRIIDVNPRCGELLRAPPPALLGRAVVDFVAPESREQVISHLRTGSGDPYEHIALRADGTRFPVEVQAKTVTIGGRTLRVTALRDISQRQSLERQVRTSQRMESVGRLAGGIAHDFNNLLTVILSVTKLRCEGKLDSSQAEDLRQIQAAAERAAGLTRQLLAFARKQIAEPKVIDLNVLVGDMDKILRRVIGEDIDLLCICRPDLGRIRADPGQIEQVIMNLVVNARDAMDGGGKLTIETANVTLGPDYAAQHPGVVPGPYVMITVADTGRGMDSHTMGHIFEPFFSTKSPGKGTGLGLATCYGIAKQSGGSIFVYSEPGRGSTFNVYFPRVWDEVGTAAKPVVEAAPGGHEALLVVEDNDMVRRLAVRVLSNHGYRVLEAPDGVEALRLFDELGGGVDILITDVVLPRMSGKELADRLRERRPDMKVLYASGYTEDTIVHRGVLDPGVSFLPKPYLPTELARRVRQTLDQK